MRDNAMTLKEHKQETISMCEYFTTQIENLKDYMDIKFKSIEDSTRLAQDNLNTRLEGMNEFRNSMKDQTARFITRVEHDAMMTKYDADIRILREQNARNDGKASMNAVYVGYAFAIIAIVISFVKTFV